MRRAVVLLAALLASLPAVALAQAQGWTADQDGMNFACYDVGSFSANNLTSGGPAFSLQSTGEIVNGNPFISATSWFVDPVNGSDAAACTTSATSCKTMRELARRWSGGEVTANTTITILGNIPGSDVAAWNFTVKTGVAVTIIGSLGPTTGFGGAAIDNTVYSGSVTGFVAASATPAADDIELTDSAIPTSFTASGVLANGVILRANSGTHNGYSFYALKDLGSKTIRVTVPTDFSGHPMNTALTNGDTYAAYAMWQMPTQIFGAAVQNILIDSLFLNGGSFSGQVLGAINGASPARIWYGTRGMTFVRSGNTLLNVLLGSTSNITLGNASGGDVIFVGGGGRGSGATLVSASACVIIMQGSPVFQGMTLQSGDAAFIAIESEIAFHDTTSPMLVGAGNGVVAINGAGSGQGVSGKGNTSKIVNITSNGNLTWGLNSANPPFISGVTTDASPIEIGGINYTVAALPAVANSRLSSTTQFPSTIYETGGPALLTWDAVPANTCVERNGSSQLVGVACSAGGTVTGVSATNPLFITGGASPTPNVTIQGSIVSGSTSTSAINLGTSVSNAILACSTASSICTPSAVTVAGGLNYNTGTGTLTDGSFTCGANTFVSSSSTSGLACTQPAFSNLSGSLSCAQLPAFAGDLSSAGGTCSVNVTAVESAASAKGYIDWTAISAPANPAGTVTREYNSLFGAGLVTLDSSGNARYMAPDHTCGASTWMSSVTSGTDACTQPAFTDVSGSVACAQTPAFTGDVTKSAASCATVLANIPNDTPMAGDLLATAIAIPSTPGAGLGRVWVDSTSKNLAVRNDAGAVRHAMQTAACGATQFFSGSADTGVFTCTGGLNKTLSYYVAAFPATLSAWLATSSTSGIAGLAIVEYPLEVASVSARVTANVTANSKSCVGSPHNLGVYITQNTTQIALASVVDGTTGLFDSGVVSVSGATSDTWGVEIVPNGSVCSGTLDMTVTATVLY